MSSGSFQNNVTSKLFAYNSYRHRYDELNYHNQKIRQALCAEYRNTGQLCLPY